MVSRSSPIRKTVGGNHGATICPCKLRQDGSGLALTPGGESLHIADMTKRDLKAIETWTDLAGEQRDRAEEAEASAEGETLRADADRLDTLIAFFKASLPAE